MISALHWFGDVGPLGFVLIYLVCTAFFVPSAALFFAGGVLFGLPMGCALVLFSSLLSASLTFFLGRHFSRWWLLDRLGAGKKFKAIDKAVAREGWKIVLLLRLAAILPFNVLNYMLGLTNISFKNYLLASFAGMFPGVLLYVCLGFLAQDLNRVHDGQTSVWQWVLLAVGFVAMAGAAYFVVRLVKKTLRDEQQIID